MSGKYGSVSQATKGNTRFGNYFDTSRKVGGGRGSQEWGTPYSKMSYGNVTLDPSIRALQEEGLGQVRQQYGETQAYGDELINNSRGLRERYLGNESAYKQSLINPLLEQVSQRRGELTRNLGMRGLSGSSFGEQSLNNFETESGRALTDARAQAEFSNLEALTGVDAQLAQNMFGKVALEMQLTGMTLEQAKQRLEQEMGALGLGTQQQQLMMQNFEAQQSRGYQERKAIADNISSYFGKSGGGGGGGGSG